MREGTKLKLFFHPLAGDSQLLADLSQAQHSVIAKSKAQFEDLALPNR